MAAPMRQKVELGFVEKSPKWRLISQLFPSKVGGKPAWLNLQEIPGSNDLSCQLCGKTSVFLLQVYCPPSEEDVAPDVKARCFHRSVYIFCCREPSCHKTNASRPRTNPFVAIRCQLQRTNTFFSSDPPDLECETKGVDIVSPAKFGVNLCELCGCNAGTTKCGRCNLTPYCCRDHQVRDWKAGHKTTCGKDHGATQEDGKRNLLFPEYELVTETEESEEEHEEGEVHENERPSGCKEDDERGSLLDELKCQGGYEEKDLEAMARGETEDDKQFTAFKKRIATDPDQVMRYQKGGDPLFVSSSHQPQEGDIPLCTCGARRIFEFQVMPQLLTHLDVDSLGESIDWGTLLIYTCSQSCQEGPAYHKEFIWKQDFQNSSL